MKKITLILVSISYLSFNAQQVKQDSLTFQKEYSKKTLVIYTGDKIKTKTLNNEKTKGIIDSIHLDTLFISKKNIQTKVAIDSLKKLALFPKTKLRTITGSFLSMSSALIMGAAHIVGIGVWIQDNNPDSFYIGFALYPFVTPIFLAGEHIRFKKRIHFNREYSIGNKKIIKKWEIDSTSI